MASAVKNGQSGNPETEYCFSFTSDIWLAQEGGHASGFTHAVPNDFSAIKRLMWVRGRRQVRADVVPMSWSSINNSDCFIVDMGTVS